MGKQFEKALPQKVKHGVSPLILLLHTHTHTHTHTYIYIYIYIYIYSREVKTYIPQKQSLSADEWTKRAMSIQWGVIQP